MNHYFVGSVLQCCSFVDPFEKDEPLSELLISRLREESVEIILTEVMDDLFAATSRHTFTTDSSFITFPKH